MIKRALAAAAALAVLPVATQAQTLQYPGFYVGAIGGLNWTLNNSSSLAVSTPSGFGWTTATNSYDTGWAVGGMVGYDFVGPRVEVEGMYRQNNGTISANGSINGFGGSAFTQLGQFSVMGNLLYDFNAGGVIVPYVGVGAGVAFLNQMIGGGSTNSTQFAYQAMVGVGYNIDPMFRINLEGRYYGTTSPTFQTSGNWINYYSNPQNNNFSVLASLQVRFGAPTVAPPPPPPQPVAATSFMVFFDWDRSNLSAQALSTIQQAANAFKTKGNARITATGHTDTTGPASYNMALSLRRANAVKDALVRDGVPATAIVVVGKGETQLLVQTGDQVREPQNRRVEIVLQ